MTEAATGLAPCTPGGPGLDLVGLCVNVDPVFDLGAHVLVLLILPFFLAALSGEKWRARVRLWLYGGSWGEAYAALLGAMLARLEKWFGPPLSWRAFEMCYRIAALYCCIIWVILEIEHSEGDTFAYAYTIFALMSAFGGALLLGRWIRRTVDSVGHNASTHKTIFLFSFEVVIIYLLINISVGFGQVFHFSGTSMAAITSIALVFAAGAFRTLIAVIIFLYLSEFDGDNEIVFFFIFPFIIIPPAINACFDWMSWWASRVLMARLRQDARRRDYAATIALFMHLLADMLIAALCLFSLAIVVANFNFSLNAKGAWEQLASARHSAFSGYGLQMTIMLASTLVPTAIHLFFAIFALAVLRPPFRARAAFALQEDQEGGERATQALVALYLTACAGFAMLVLWGVGRLALMGLGTLSEHGFWALIFETADRFVIVGPVISPK